ncbi:hypothetical protein DRN69_02640 [Candidatus Pacearchaeota archaeon]|nr:MAG: hypothetical protein DRN69_02640 [Candidatus Pacearchaeota archaeon]
MSLKLIILDIETTGLTGRNGIWQIAALEFENPENYFLQEARIDDEDEIMESALRICGKREGDLRDPSKQSQKQMIENYLDWLKQFKERIIWGANVAWDISIIQGKCIEYGLSKKFLDIHGHRGMDILTLAQERYYEIHGEYLLNKNGKHDMNLSNVLKLCGIPDERVNIQLTGEIKKEGEPHSALKDCRLEAECLSRLKFGKNLFSEYAQYKIPEVLKK